jgi:nucleoside-diphosphate-sugar epimerase
MNGEKMLEQNGARLLVVVVGTDNWLRSRVVERLLDDGIKVRDLSRGTASLPSVDVVVARPALAPTPGSAERATGTEAAQITFNAVMANKIRRLVLVSRVGSSTRADSSYLAALADIEHKASNATSKLTVIRVTHPFGPVDDAGPMVKSMIHGRRAQRGESTDGDDPKVQPVYVDDIADLVVAAVSDQVGLGLMELGGPDTMPLSQFAAFAVEAAGAGGSGFGRPSRSRLPGSRRRQAESVEAVLSCDSVASRRLAPPEMPGLRRLCDVWGVSGSGWPVASGSLGSGFAGDLRPEAAAKPVT